MPSPLVTVEWLADHLDDPELRIVDGSWYLPQQKRDPEAEFLTAHIPGSVHFDIDKVADKSSGLPHMLASPETFAEAAGALGIGRTDTIVVYDGMGIFSAARVWWNFKVMGAVRTFVLAGGFPAWQAASLPTESGTAAPLPATFDPMPIARPAVTAREVLAILAEGSAQLVDVRPRERFLGQAPEPRPGLRSGHMPNSRNLPFSELIGDGSLRPPSELLAAIRASGIDPQKPIVASCGSGVTAALVPLALAELGVEAMTIYDGSWAEWGADPGLPVETG